MSALYKLNIQEMASVSPSKVCLTTSITKSYKNSLGTWELKQKTKSPSLKNGEKTQLKKKWHNMEIIKNSQRNLRHKI